MKTPQLRKKTLKPTVESFFLRLLPTRHAANERPQIVAFTRNEHHATVHTTLHALLRI
jgi:hypothetical protein